MVLEFLLTVLSLLLSPCHCQTAQILPPQNVSVDWENDFKPGLTWLPPHHSIQNCKYEVSFITKIPFSRESLTLYESSWYISTALEGGFMQWSISTVYKENRSVPVVLNVSNPDLVENLKCYLFTPTQGRCEWEPNLNPPDLKFFYDLVNMHVTESNSSRIVECSSYIYNKTMKTGCEIPANTSHIIYILFNGTLNNKPVKNTFLRKFYKDVRPPPLTLTATKTGNKINISWIKPDFLLNDWTFKILYSECDAFREPISIKDETAFQLDSVSHCQYNLSIRAESENGKTPWSDWKHFDAEHDSNMELKALAIIPIVLGVLAAVLCVCCQKNWRLFFPKVPKPTDFLTDIMDDKFAASNVNILAKEEEDCIVTLVIDPPKLKAQF